ncbi:MAG: alpha/beta fold hydrolase [Cyclobacteriaceae bacterium]|nr:alpha/beta fold hydrolase [Cyclobacteriaceae bacterium]
MKLFYKSRGKGNVMIILHGLFGSSDNWQSIAKKFSEINQVISVDQRNHGRSFHHQKFDYDVMVEDLEHLYQSLNLAEAVLIGHSMGGKTAMKFALKNPALVSKLIVVDIAPKYYPIHHDEIIDALCNLKIKKTERREELDRSLAKSIPNPVVRQFLLKNVERDAKNNLKWRINLPVIRKNLDKIGEEIKGKEPYNRPALFIAGALSNYVKTEDEGQIKNLFPKATITYFKKAGHWIHADAPEDFIELVASYIK